MTGLINSLPFAGTQDHHYFNGVPNQMKATAYRISQSAGSINTYSKSNKKSILMMKYNAYFAIIIALCAFCQVGCGDIESENHKDSCVDYKSIGSLVSSMEQNEVESHGLFLTGSRVVEHCKKGLHYMSQINSVLQNTNCKNCKDGIDIKPLLDDARSIENKLYKQMNKYQ